MKKSLMKRIVLMFVFSVLFSGFIFAQNNKNISFETKDIYGKNINQSIFKDYKITMINIWATWCPPCVGEIPELAQLPDQLPQGTQLISLCIDGKDSPDMARKIFEKYNAKYPALIPNQTLEQAYLTNVSAVPTTIFVDSLGNIVGKPIIGVPGSDPVSAYLAHIKSLIK